MAFTLKVTGAAHYAVVNPDTIAAQVQGRALFGLTALRYGATPLKGGRTERSNLHDYRRMRMNGVPAIESHIKSAEVLGGFGEAASACVTPAMTQAIFAVAGTRIRPLPIDTNRLQS
jgi:isoquinoline 1-oxidoreductase beta subunit